ncbi:MAG: polysaccharide biosynthesis tyrosine autokinase [Sinobacteraceae bacterium]|nr:polysaccharide biosynthesis tyrosine autokinase [Nevskiaceae bacterium]
MSIAQATISPGLPANGDARQLNDARFGWSDVVRMADRRRRLILTVAGLVIALTAAVLLLLPTLYSASAVVMLEQRKNNVADASSVLSSLPTDAASVQNQIQILTSRDLAAQVVDKLELQSDPEFNGRGGFLSTFSSPPTPETTHERVINAFLSRLLVENEGLSTAITISFKARTAEKAARIANAVAETYVHSQLETKFAATREATDWLENRVRVLARQVQSADAAVERYKAEHNLSESTGGVPLVEQQISGVSAQLVQAKADLAQRQATFARVDSLSKAGQAADISQAVASPLIIQLRSQEADLIRSEADLQTRYGPKHPKYIAVESQKHDLEQKISQEVTRITGSLSNDVSVARSQVASLENSLALAEQQAHAQNLLRVKLQSLEANAASTRSIYEAFLARLRAIQDQSAIEASDARVISHAAAPSAPSSPRRTLIFAASLPASLMLGFLAALLAERIAPISQVQSSDPARGLPVVAEIAGVTNTRAADLVLDYPTSAYAQSIGEIARQITHSTAPGRSCTILVTSPQMGEGASTIAVSVARAAAILGRRVVLLDANVWSPSVLPITGIRNLKCGLLELLSGRAALSRAVARDPRSSALLLSVSRPQSQRNRTIASAQFRRLIAHLSKTCDLLLILAPPVVAQPGAAVLARQADAVMLVARGPGATQPAVAQAAETLARVPAPPIGLILAS